MGYVRLERTGGYYCEGWLLRGWQGYEIARVIHNIRTGTWACSYTNLVVDDKTVPVPPVFDSIEVYAEFFQKLMIDIDREIHDGIR